MCRAQAGDLGVDPAECVYVGDGADDELGAAAALGMDVVRSTQFKPASGSWPPARIAALNELPALLGTPLRSAAVPAVPAPADFEKVVDVSGLSEAPRFS